MQLPVAASQLLVGNERAASALSHAPWPCSLRDDVRRHGGDMSDANDQVAQEFASTLNRHGHAFQAAVLEEARRLYDNGDSQFVLDVAEFPVQIRNAATRIDLVLRHRRRDVLL